MKAKKKANMQVWVVGMIFSFFSSAQDFGQGTAGSSCEGRL